MRTVLEIDKVEFSSYPQRIAARLFDNILTTLLFLAFLALNGEHLTLNTDKLDPYLGVGNLIWFLPLFSLAYEVPTMAMSGVTLGKRLLGICVVRTDGLIGIGLDRALIRYLTPLALAVIPFVGLFAYIGGQAWFFFDPRRQNVPDKAARTFVIRIPRNSSDVPELEPPQEW